MTDIIKSIDLFLNEKEDSTTNAAKTLTACISFYEKQDSLDSKGKEVLTTLKGIADYYKKNKSFSPGQAKTIFNVSKGIEKITKG